MKWTEIALLVTTAVAVPILVPGADALAQSRPQTSPGITFSATETAIIVRNAVLSKAVASDPAIVRRVLDEFAKMDTGMTTKRTTAPSPDARPAFDKQTNPDLNRLERASPEGVHDLFQLLKKAAARKPSNRNSNN